MKNFPALLLFALLSLFSGRLWAQPESADALTEQDSAALASALDVAAQYADFLNNYFNEGAKLTEDFRGQFVTLFTGSQKILADYTSGVRRVEPAEYLFDADQIFTGSRPAVQSEIDRDAAQVKYFPNDRFHMAAIPVTNQFTSYFDQAEGVVVNDTVVKYLTLEVRIGSAENARINRTIEASPALYLAEEREAEARAKALSQSDKEEAPKKRKSSRLAREKRSGTSTPSLIFAGFVTGGDFNATTLNTLSGDFNFRDHSFSKTDISLDYIKAVSSGGLYINAGVGISMGRLHLNYGESTYSFEQEDMLNPSPDVQHAPAGAVSMYERTADVRELNEKISFTDINFRIGLGFDFLNGSDDLLIMSAGMMFGVGLSQRSEITATTDYHGRFSEVNGIPIDLTLGVNEDIPAYGFEERTAVNNFEMETDLLYNAFLNITYAKHFGNHFYVGLRAEAQAPLNNWMTGTADHEVLFRSHGAIEGSVADTVSDIRRPLFFGGGLMLGFKF